MRIFIVCNPIIIITITIKNYPVWDRHISKIDVSQIFKNYVTDFGKHWGRTILIIIKPQENKKSDMWQLSIFKTRYFLL